MGAPDTSDIDLNPANFRCRADLVYCLEKLYNKSGRPSYRDLQKIGKSMGIKLATSTIGELIGKNSKTSTRKTAWKTVELFVLICGVPQADLEGWRRAWEATVAPDRPAWQEERQHLLAKIDQLTTDLATAEARTSKLTTDLAKEREYNYQRRDEASRRIHRPTTAVEGLGLEAREAHARLAAALADAEKVVARIGRLKRQWGIAWPTGSSWPPTEKPPTTTTPGSPLNAGT